MTTSYENNMLRASADPPTMVLPGDHVRARESGFDKKYSDFPILDEPIHAVVQALALRNWDVPGIDCKFNVLDRKNLPVHHLLSINGGVQGMKWSVVFNRARYVCGDKNIFTEASTIHIPGHDLELYDDKSSNYFPYVGNNWYEDEEAFQTQFKDGACKKGLDRTYLLYGLHTHVYYHTTEFGAEYDIEDEPKKIPVEDVHGKFGDFFKTLLHKIEATPVATNDPYAVWKDLARVEPVAAPTGLPSFYVITSMVGEPDPQKMQLHSGNSFMFPDKMKPVYGDYVTHKPVKKSQAHPMIERKYCFGFPDMPYKAQSGMWGKDPTGRDMAIIKVNLKYANDVFVVDEKPMIAARSYLLNEAFEQDRLQLTEQENDELLDVLQKTYVPLAEYKNDYEKPIFLLDRPLWSDEAQNITQKIRDNMGSLTDPTDPSYYTRMYRLMKAML